MLGIYMQKKNFIVYLKAAKLGLILSKWSFYSDLFSLKGENKWFSETTFIFWNVFVIQFGF